MKAHRRKSAMQRNAQQNGKQKAPPQQVFGQVRARDTAEEEREKAGVSYNEP